ARNRPVIHPRTNQRSVCWAKIRLRQGRRAVTRFSLESGSCLRGAIRDDIEVAMMGQTFLSSMASSKLHQLSWFDLSPYYSIIWLLPSRYFVCLVDRLNLSRYKNSLYCNF